MKTMNSPLYRSRSVKKGVETLGNPSPMLSAALADSHKAVFNGAIFAAVDRDSQGADHPDNAGKFFLYQFVKA